MVLLKSVNPAIPVNILVDLINEFLDFFNVGKNMTASQVAQTVRIILQDYAVLKPDDFVLFFDRAKKGWYGKAYDRMDGAVILEWLELYMQQRNEEIEQIRVNEAKKLSRQIPDEIGVPMPDYLKEYRDKIDINKSEKAIIPSIVSPLDDIIHNLLIEFGHLSNEQKTPHIVEVDGKRYDKEQFLKMKLGFK